MNVNIVWDEPERVHDNYDLMHANAIVHSQCVTLTVIVHFSGVLMFA